ncbi:hypothetical protein B0T22DRAFT_474350 [Podospora appendiculata]|uniref:FAD-binding PCMH-type domain-containing protein n=1 Tax=Podospora appendiculata TaxID=314037 RepID=A0AAE0WYL5_9PEZI|nr:hypothetical protein B0T22DRAFT_474350 [Podospora appendiculata]
MFASLIKVAAAAGLVQTSLALVVRDALGSTASTTKCNLDWTDAAPLKTTYVDGVKYGCKCYFGDDCWPAASAWQRLNQTVDGSLSVNMPPGAACHNTFAGPFGTVNTYNAAACADITANFADESWTVSQPAAALWTYWTGDTCRPSEDPTASCTLGNYGVYVIKATKHAHIKAGVDFARKNNIRLVLRNTGHDFIGRSVGYGSLVINTHSFKDVQWINKYAGAGSYHGSAVKVSAGIQGREILAMGHARSPPLVVVTGECPTVGIAGGFIQGGGHGPWTTLKGFSADNVLAFEVITASGLYAVANEVENADLFYALKGGGPASYAVILTVTMKTFPDQRASGATLYINSTHTTDADVWWNGTAAFHKYANHFVDNGLYVYYEMFPQSLRVRPFVAIEKTAAQLQALVQPMLNELDAQHIPYEFAVKEFPTFFDLYNDLFEGENAGDSAISGGWMLNHADMDPARTPLVMDAMKKVFTPARPSTFSFMIGHLFNPGYNVPVSNSATNPAWRNATDFIITNIIVPVGVDAGFKAYLQDVLTNDIDEALRSVSSSDCTYVNEADPYQTNWQGRFWGSVYPTLRRTRNKWDPLGVFYAISTPGTEGWALMNDTKLCKKLD